MKKHSSIFLIALLTLFSVGISAYIRTVYRFEVPKVETERMIFGFSLPVGTCNLYAEEQPIPICLEGQLQEGELKNVHFFYEPKGKDYAVDFSLSHEQKLSIEEMQQQRELRKWKVALSPEQRYGLKLTYGWGNAMADFSKLQISNLQINTGHASVHAIHRAANPNALLMESYKVNVEYGSLKIDNLDMANSPFFDAEVGVGKLELNFSKQLYRNCQVKVNVGAGELSVNLPSKSDGVRLKVTSSSFISDIMSDAKIPEGFHKYQGYLVNDAYLNKTFKNMVTFDVNVSAGNVNFKWSDRS